MTERHHLTETSYEGRPIYLLGTAHVSKASVEEVERVILELRPDTVCVELDQNRYEALVDRSRFRKLEAAKIIREKKVLLTLASVALTAFQRRMGDKLGVMPGAELLKAVESAEAIGAKVVLADRNVEVTLKRTWRGISALDKAQLLVGLFTLPVSDTSVSANQVEDLKDKDTISRLLNELAEMMPGIKGPLIDERDQYLVSMIQEASGKTVAVVGAGHVSGMLGLFGQRVDRSELSRLPKPALGPKILRWAIPAGALFAFARAYAEHSFAGVGQLLPLWAAPTAGAVALACLVLRAHPLTLLLAALAAPVLALVPLMSAGTWAGLVEAKVRPASADQRERVIDDALAKRLRQNPFTRALFITLAATIGTGFGAFVGLLLVLLFG